LSAWIDSRRIWRRSLEESTSRSPRSVYRPAVILGNSNMPGIFAYVMPLLHWAISSKYHSIHKNDLARAMVAQSEHAFLAIAQGNAPEEATVKILEYKEMAPFFIQGESDEP
jgi:hypothetical protein